MTSALTNPFGEAKPAAGAVAAMERREEAEIMAMVAVAKRFPRDPRAACDKILQEFSRPTLADEAVFSYSRGGQDISDLTIRAAEAIASAWGNIRSGWREVSRSTGDDGVPYSLVEARAWDLETTTDKLITFIVRHWRDTKRGGYKLTDERDIYELCANMAQRRLRSCIMSLIPGDVKELARKQAETTLATHAEVTPEGLKQMLERFSAWGITKEHIEKKIQRNLESMAPAQFVQMRKIYRSLQEGMGKPGDFFEGFEERPASDGPTNLDDIKAKAKPAATPAPTPSPAPAAEGAPAQADGGPVAPTPETLVDKMKKARSSDSLDLLADWIDERNYPDEAVRIMLREHYNANKARLEK